MSDQIDIQKLLRLKRYEQPEPEYFQDFLEEFQRRQRAELLKRSLWQIFRDRTNAFVGHFSLAQYTYGMASASVLVVAGLVSFGILSGIPERAQYAADTNGTSARVQPVTGTPLVFSPDEFGNDLNFSNGGPMLHASISAQPRYVIDARPVSYEAPFSF
jgi:hypothetical protein